MEKTLSTKFESNNSLLSETIRCTTCNKEFATPIFAVISSGYLIEEYYACPRCLSKVTKIEAGKTIEVEETEEEKQEEAPAQKLEIAIEEKREETFGCSHHLGYLKQRPKNTPIPEECLTCAKMIECMT
ncbi:MAG: hypothetical protein QXJ76_07385 [Candidatus Bathyarchaeia archaeon]